MTAWAQIIRTVARLISRAGVRVGHTRRDDRRSLPSAPVSPHDLLDDSRWLSLVTDCVALYEELDWSQTRSSPVLRELADHVCCRLQEILERSGVTLIADDATFDRQLHRVDTKFTSLTHKPNIVETLRPGFRVGSRVLLRARVRMYEKSSTQTGGDG